MPRCMIQGVRIIRVLALPSTNWNTVILIPCTIVMLGSELRTNETIRSDLARSLYVEQHSKLCSVTGLMSDSGSTLLCSTARKGHSRTLPCGYGQLLAEVGSVGAYLEMQQYLAIFTSVEGEA